MTEHHVEIFAGCDQQLDFLNVLEDSDILQKIVASFDSTAVVGDPQQQQQQVVDGVVTSFPVTSSPCASSLPVGECSAHAQDPGCPRPGAETEESRNLDLVVATFQAEAEGTNMALVKEEIRFKIQKRRRDSGLAELKANYAHVQEERLTPREVEKRERRRAQNRKAARRSRLKKHGLHRVMSEEHRRLVLENGSLRGQVQDLKTEVATLDESLEKHMKQHCQLGVLVAAPGECNGVDN